MKVVIYARCALQDKGGKSIEQQVNECYEYGRKNNMIVIGKYIDDGFSGTTDNRPEFQKMIKDSSKGKFQGVLVYQLDKFAINEYDCIIYKLKFKKNSIKLLSARENITENTSSILMEKILEGMAEYYSAEHSRKIKEGIARKKKEREKIANEG